MPPSPPACAARSPLRPSGTRRCILRATEAFGTGTASGTARCVILLPRAMRTFSLMESEPRPEPTLDGLDVRTRDASRLGSERSCLGSAVARHPRGHRRGLRLRAAVPPTHPELAALQALRGAVRRARRAGDADVRSGAVGEEPDHLRLLLQGTRERDRGGAEIELTLLFADIRGSTGLGESMGAASFHRLMGRFYHEMTKVLVAHDAVVDKFVGDEVVALFIPALTGADHAGARSRRRARCSGSPAMGMRPVRGRRSGSASTRALAYVGTVGDTVTDFTALGDTVNVTAPAGVRARPAARSWSAPTLIARRPGNGSRNAGTSRCAAGSSRSTSACSTSDTDPASLHSAAMDLHVIGPLASPAERAAVDGVLGPAGVGLGRRAAATAASTATRPAAATRSGRGAPSCCRRCTPSRTGSAGSASRR